MTKADANRPRCMTNANKSAEKRRHRDLAFEQLAISARNPVGMDYGDLKLNPLWGPLRGDPRFERIVVSLAPKE